MSDYEPLEHCDICDCQLDGEEYVRDDMTLCFDCYEDGRTDDE